MRQPTITGLVCMLFFCTSCKLLGNSRSHNNDTSQKRQFVVFNWASNSGNLESHLRAQIGGAFQKNQAITNPDQLPDTGLMGYGLYAAIDPFISANYGNELFCLTLKPNIKAVLDEGGSDEDKLKLIRSNKEMILYGWNPSPLHEEDYTAAVLRDMNSIDQSKSLKLSMRSLGTMNGLSSQKLAQGRAALRENNICKALSIYENEFASFAYSLLSVGFDWKTPRTFNKAMMYAIKAPGDQPPGLGFFPDFANAIRAIASDKKLIEELTRQFGLAGQSQQQIESSISEILADMLSITPKSNLVQITKDVINKSGFIKLKYTGNDKDALWQSIFMGYSEKMEQWKKDHPDEADFMNELWKHLSASRMRSHDSIF
jgi:hypothetical protein